MTAATLDNAGAHAVLRGPATAIRRGDQVAFPLPDDDSGAGVAGGVTAVRTGPDPATVALVVANRVHFLPAHHDVVIIRDAARSGNRLPAPKRPTSPAGSPGGARGGGSDGGPGAGEAGAVAPTAPDSPGGAWRASPRPTRSARP